MEALDGVAYWTDADGIIQGGAAASWNDFARENGAPSLTLDAVIGRNLLDLIAGDDVRAVYEAVFDEVRSLRRPRVTLAYRCDAPDVERQMRMTVGPLARDGEVFGFFLHSQIISERQRPPLDLLSYRDALTQLKGDTAPVLAICSFCHDVRGVDGNWLSLELYYRCGGSGEVRLSHGVCDSCTTCLADLGADELAGNLRRSHGQ